MKNKHKKLVIMLLLALLQTTSLLAQKGEFYYPVGVARGQISAIKT
jgi:hypothetical protein